MANIPTRAATPTSAARNNDTGWAVFIGYRLTPQFSGGAMLPVPWHFIPHRPLQLLVSRHLNSSETADSSIMKKYGSIRRCSTMSVTPLIVTTSYMG